LAVAGLAAGVATVVTLGVLGRSAKPDPARLGIGTASDFPAGSITRVERSVPFFDAVGLEAGPPSSLGPHRRPGVRVFVTHDSAGLHALLARAPSYGCQIVADHGAVAREWAINAKADPDAVSFVDQCHGGLFGADGTHLGGPGHRGLDWFPVRYQPDGVVTIDLTDLHAGTASA